MDTACVSIVGGIFGNGIGSGHLFTIMWYVGTPTGEFLEKGRINIQTSWGPDGDIDLASDPLWDSLPGDFIPSAKMDAVPLETGICEFAKWIDGLEHKYKTVMFICPTPSGFALLDYKLEEHCSRDPVIYTTTGEGRQIICAHDILGVMDTWSLHAMDTGFVATCPYLEYQKYMRVLEISAIYKDYDRKKRTAPVSSSDASV